MTNICRAKTGMLVLQDCGRPASGACVSCGRPVCGKHKCETAKGTACPECAAMDASAAKFTGAGDAQAASQIPVQPGKPDLSKQERLKRRLAQKSQQQTDVPLEEYDNLSPAGRAHVRRAWFDPYPFYISSPYFFHYSDYNSFDYRDDTGAMHAAPGSADGYDGTES